ncbi:unnamed protein product [Dibothriocephalus latus]|uniref:Uncharacterized protein n=1 Tax=Dibothriocephalus latus TaxID=60516 RepID=A0A3P7MFF3_DIBLA|nr:unnamed protein product [Dibothriocephalus latus]
MECQSPDTLGRLLARFTIMRPHSEDYIRRRGSSDCIPRAGLGTPRIVNDAAALGVVSFQPDLCTAIMEFAHGSRSEDPSEMAPELDAYTAGGWT